MNIPNAVCIEATRVHGAPGAGRIVEWINDHLDQVRIVPTDVGIDQQRRLEEGRSIRGLGEQAAIEALERFLLTDQTAEALLLFEDSDIEKRRAIVGERASLISTGDLLREWKRRDSSNRGISFAIKPPLMRATSNGSAKEVRMQSRGTACASSLSEAKPIAPPIDTKSPSSGMRAQGAKALRPGRRADARERQASGDRSWPLV